MMRWAWHLTLPDRYAECSPGADIRDPDADARGIDADIPAFGTEIADVDGKARGIDRNFRNVGADVPCVCEELPGPGAEVPSYQTYVAGDATTRSIVVKRYDAAGRLAFQSYPVRNLGNWTDTTLKGTHTTYDALDRVTQATQDSELGPLVTTTEYLDGFQTRVTNPRLLKTTTRYLAWDQPSTDFPVAVTHPAGAYTDIVRDPHGKPLSITRRNADSSVATTRTSAYNANQELCRAVEPETGATLMGYDAAGNLAWSAAGLASGTACDPEGDTAAILARKASRSYDARNRLMSVSFPDGLGNTVSAYTPDGLLAAINADNGGTAQVTTAYTYNRRRLPASENMTWGGIDWTLGYGYNANGHLSSQSYPGGLSIAYAPNALGQPIQAGSYATGVSYHPNGAIAQFTYGNGIVHTLTQNARQLPEISQDAYGTTAFLSDTYAYDQNGNVAAITDGATGRNMRGNRDMTYDGLDRLTKVVSETLYGTQGANYWYNVLDDLTRVYIGGAAARNHWYCYDGQRRLTFLRSGSICSGTDASPAVHALSYNVQGNLKSKDASTFAFDYGNRLRSNASPAGSYVYDGHGRRVRDFTTASKYSLYSQSGQLAFTNDFRAQKNTNYIYLGGSLVATREWAHGTTNFVAKYTHTDALGSPVVETDANRAVLARYEYEPYGKGGPADKPSYTGHVLDAATGLNYMQQRYYDPLLGRFLSVDPVSATSVGGNFNRYWYANNNPYRYTDPDGRVSDEVERQPRGPIRDMRTLASKSAGLAAEMRVTADMKSGPGSFREAQSQAGTSQTAADTPGKSHVQRVTENLCGQTAGNCASRTTAPPPDYVKSSGGAYIANGQAAYTSNQSLFVGGELVNKLPGPQMRKPGWSLTMGYMLTDNRRPSVDAFMDGSSASWGGCWGVCFFYSSNLLGQSIEVGVGTSQLQLGSVDYMHPVDN